MTGYFIYGDVDTRNYEGIVVSEDEVDSAPERAYEEITIAGRNGTLLLDGNRYENVIHSYDITVYDDYVDNLIKLRNDILSKVGYQVLRDSFNPDEKYLARVYTQVTPNQKIQRNAGNMHIEFSRKPQRFLVDGDREILPTEWTDVQTESGELVTVDSDGSLAVKSLEVSLEPIQDLNGYDAPWVGGAGKNKLPYPYTNNSGTTNGITYSTTADGRVTISGTATATAWIKLYGGFATDTSLKKPVPSWITADTDYVLSGGQSSNFYVQANLYSGTSSIGQWQDTGSGESFSLTSEQISNADSFAVFIRVNSGQTVNATITPMIEEGSAKTSWTPYENICPISGRTEVKTIVSPTTSATDGRTYTTALGRTVYGGTLDVVTGELVVTDGYIASYNGESLPSTWISDRDVYASGTTPTTGAQVAYKLATPQTYQLTPQQIDLLLGTNHLWSDGEITVEYGVHPYYNPTSFNAKPLIKVTGTGTLGIGEYILTITGTASQTLYIDCETMEIYTLEGTVPTGASSLVSINKNDFPVLEPGTNYISVGSGITAVTIKPRWWRI